jgi:hypothetical protein
MNTATRVDAHSVRITPLPSQHFSWRATVSQSRAGSQWLGRARRPCIIPVEGFFEWKAIKGQTPRAISLATVPPLPAIFSDAMTPIARRRRFVCSRCHQSEISGP